MSSGTTSDQQPPGISLVPHASLELYVNHFLSHISDHLQIAQPTQSFLSQLKSALSLLYSPGGWEQTRTVLVDPGGPRQRLAQPMISFVSQGLYFSPFSSVIRNPYSRRPHYLQVWMGAASWRMSFVSSVPKQPCLPAHAPLLLPSGCYCHQFDTQSQTFPLPHQAGTPRWASMRAAYRKGALPMSAHVNPYLFPHPRPLMGHRTLKRMKPPPLFSTHRVISECCEAMF